MQVTDSQTQEAQTRDVAEKAAKGPAAGTSAAALAMVLGAIAASVGGKAGQRDQALEIEREMEPIRNDGQTTLRRA